MGAACFKSDQPPAVVFTDVRTAHAAPAAVPVAAPVAAPARPKSEAVRKSHEDASPSAVTISPFTGAAQQDAHAGSIVIAPAADPPPVKDVEGEQASLLLEGRNSSQPSLAAIPNSSSMTPPHSELGSNATSGTSAEQAKVQPSGFQTLSPAKLATEVAQMSWIGHGGYGAVYKGVWQASGILHRCKGWYTQ